MNVITAALKRLPGLGRQCAGIFSAVVLFGAGFTPALGQAQTLIERPGPYAMAADAVIARPAQFVGTVLGAGIFVASLPVSVLGGNVDEAAEHLVAKPFRATFFRCLGCTNKHYPQGYNKAYSK